jgi:hypothetical protein
MNTMMKKLFIELCIIFITGSCALCMGHNSATDTDLFLQANECYKKGDFAHAYDNYDHIQGKTPIIHYNLGNCAYKLNKLGYALLHWRRAENDWGLWDRDDLIKNIAIVRKHIKEKTNKAAKEPTILASVMNGLRSSGGSIISLVRAIPLIYLQLFVLIMWLLLFIYLKNLYRHGRKSIIYLLFILLTISAATLILKYSFCYRKQLVITHTPATLMSGPDNTFAALGQLSEGEEAVIIKKSGDYYKIRINGTTGWIHKQSANQI